jgi:membrane protease YdiL (CAAX protease family)
LTVFERLFALLVAVVLPTRAWLRHRAGSPPAPNARYIAETLILLASLGLLLWRRGITDRDLGLSITSPLQTLSGVLFAIAVVVGSDAFQVWRIVRRFQSVVLDAPQGLAADALTAKDRGMLSIVATAVGAIWEELCFRGTVFALLPNATPGWLAAGVAGGAVLFGMQHLRSGLSGLLYSTGFGVLFALLYLLTGNLYAVIIAHAAGNVLTAWQWAPRIEAARQRAISAPTPEFLG